MILAKTNTDLSVAVWVCNYTLNSVTSSETFNSMATVWFLHRINFANANYCHGFDIYVWYCISSWNIRIIWYDTTQYISMTWYQHDGIWCQDSVDKNIIVMRVYGIKTIYISIIWCIRAVRYISMTWHDSSMIWYSVSSLGSWYHDFSVFWPFGVLALRCPGVWYFCVWGFHQTMQSEWRNHSYERFRTTKRVRYCQGKVSPRLIMAQW